MKAARVHEVGGRDAIRIEDVPTPAGEGVRVRVAAAGVNPVDWKMRAGDVPLATRPMTLGWDIAGTVIADAGGFAAGEAVYGLLPPDRLGAFAEETLAPAAALARAPASLSPSDAAAVPMGALTAWTALFDVAHLHAGERVLIHGGGGAVGAFAVQLAKARGAWVATTASGADVAWLRARGADRVIDHGAEAFDAVLTQTPVDIVLDIFGPGELRTRSWAVIANGGRMVSTLGATEPDGAAAARGVRGLAGFGVAPNGERLAEVAGMLDAGTLAVRAPTAMPLDRVADVLDGLEHGRLRGKIVLLPAA